MNLLKDIGNGAVQVLKTVAPMIADTAAGPFAPLVDPVVKKIFGTNDPKQVESALLTATPEQLLALRQADNEHTEKLTQLGIDRDKLAFDDSTSARAMQVATKDPTAGRLAWLVICGFIGMSIGLSIAMICWPDQTNKVSTAAWTLLTSLLTFLAAEAKLAGAFYFGSSAGSQAKDAALVEIAKQQ
jgi:hypothetical protein